MRSFGGFSSAITGSNFSFLLRALQSEGRLQVLSRPQILTADNQEATINIGQQVPLITNSRVTPQGDSINSFEYRNVGVTLTVVPRISPDDFVKMDIGPKISQLSSSDVPVGPGARAPIIYERSATTTVSIQSGQSIIIGGLISTSDDTRIRRVPGLGKIPYLGALFRSSQKVQDRKELLIILTPQVLVKGQEQAIPQDAKSITRQQLDRSTIQEEFKRDQLQQQMLEPLYPEKKKDAP
jgi:type II secretory pathway component GspD/PulD (secretin)